MTERCVKSRNWGEKKSRISLSKKGKERNREDKRRTIDRMIKQRGAKFLRYRKMNAFKVFITQHRVNKGEQFLDNASR